MKKKTILVVALVVLIGAGMTHWHFSNRGRLTTEPEYVGLTRTVSGNDLRSPVFPQATLRFETDFRHVGGQKFVLYGVADTEQHFFVETTADDTLKSVYWIQYEGYLPDKPYRYNYEDSPLRVNIDGYEFYTDTAAGKPSPDAVVRRGSDGALARQLLRREGYRLPEHVAYARLVHLMDDRKKELMIIFFDTVSEDDTSDERSALTQERHIERIKATLSILPNE